MDLTTEYDISKIYYWAGKDVAFLLNKTLGKKFSVSMHVDTLALKDNSRSNIAYIFTFTSDTSDVIIAKVTSHTNTTYISYYKVGDMLLTDKELSNIKFEEISSLFNMLIKKYTNNISKSIVTRRKFGRKHQAALNRLVRTVTLIDTLKQHDYVKVTK